MGNKILVVDDEEDMVGLTKKILELEGYNITIARSGRDCLEKIEKTDFDLILLDIMMPGMSGWDVFDKIQEKKSDAKVVFVSILDISEKRRCHLMVQGLAGYIKKPFSDDELVETVNNILSEKQIKVS
jgi:two-component system, OmpR family, response regulator VicR